MDLNLDLEHRVPLPARTDFGIGALGAGFIMRDVQLKAYADAGFNVVGIASRTPEIAREVADLRAIPKVYSTLQEMLGDPAIQVLDIAVPPHKQLEMVQQALEEGTHLKGILAQKPLAVNYEQAHKIVDLCASRHMPLVVNQNMRYDHSIRALKTILERGYLGTPVLATIEMRAVPHWQAWLRDYHRLTLLNMSIHHIDCFRFLFGEPQSIFVSARRDPRTTFEHEDGICLYILEYENGLRATAWDDVWTGPKTAEDNLQPYIKWRVSGTEGLAEGTIGWPEYPNRRPSTITFTSSRQPGIWITPHWEDVWFPDAFRGPMSELFAAIESGLEPPTSGRDNLRTMAIIEAGYQSIRERRSVAINQAVSEPDHSKALL